MTLPISLTCKTQEPSRTRTLRGTRGTSTGEGLRRQRQRRRRGEAASLHQPWPGCWMRRRCPQRSWSGRTASSPAGALTHATPGCPLGPRPVWPSWDHSGSSLLPRHACPRPEQASLSAPSPCLAPPTPCCPSSFISAPPLTLKSQFLWWLVGGGDVGKAHQPVLPHPCHLNLPLAWRSCWGDGSTPSPKGCCTGVAELLG